MLRNIALGTALYRLDNDFVPYRIDIRKEQKMNAVAAAKEMLDSGVETWDEMSQRLQSPRSML